MNLDSITRRFYSLCQIIIQPTDDPDLVFQKQLLMIFTLAIIPIGILWGLVYILNGEIIPSLIPIGYSLVSLANILLCRVTQRYAVFRFVQLSMILLCPFFLMVSLGGFSNGSVVIIWSVIAPFGAILFYKARVAPWWLVTYLALIIISGLLQPALPADTALPPALVTFLYVLNICVVSLVAFLLMYYFIGQKNKAYDLLRIEQEKSEELLLNVLPKEIAPELKAGEKNIAQSFESASVLFADIVGFTELTLRLKPREMVELLNEIFSHFDQLVSQYGLEKIRTIGDNYMVAAGVPLPDKDHARRLAGMALDLCTYIQEFPAYQGVKINFRVGINSGPVVAGVIGQHKFHYDVWGDTVNTASRMESSGLAGKIHITEATRRLIEDEFYCIPRGQVLVKSKGKMNTYFLEARKNGGGVGAQISTGIH
jgi:guanylate cyclase